MFLSIYENQLDKKGRVSVPASFRSYLSNLGYNNIICYPSFNNQSIEACSQERIEKLSDSIDSLNPFEEKRDFFATSILSESINLQFDSEGRISLSTKLLKHAKIKNSMLFVGQGKTFQIWEPAIFERFRTNARKKSNINRASLKWEKQFNKEGNNDN
jgi:MraZ protein